MKRACSAPCQKRNSQQAVSDAESAVTRAIKTVMRAAEHRTSARGLFELHPRGWFNCGPSFAGVNRQRFSVIYADPPWEFRSLQRQGQATSGRATITTRASLDDIKALPVPALAADDWRCFCGA